jgi:predicted RNA binding protein YcfA (HicA-like mRNA interferase family)
MRAISGRDFARMIERRGWELLRVNGSHHIYGKTGSVVRLSVPFTAIAPQDRPAAPLGQVCRNSRR